jgi:hypothetical protein
VVHLFHDGSEQLNWILEVNGLLIDVRHAPKEIQEAAFRQGVIASIPEKT